jgi:crossover junction endodeoxyribonuclease RusA
MAQPTIAYNLPFPPSINHYWRIAGKRMVISGEGKTYRELVGWMIRNPVILEGRLSVKVHAYVPDKRVRDIDNLLKVLLDSLTHAGCWQDDSQIDELFIKRAGIEKPGRVVVFITEL